jgi:hypothetical protein
MNFSRGMGTPPAIRSFFKTFPDPGEIRGRSRRNRDGNKFGHIVRVQAFHSRPQLRQTFARSFNKQQAFARGFDFPFPTINGLDRARKDVHASGETRFHHGARDALRLRRGRTCHQNHKVAGQESLQSRLLFLDSRTSHLVAPCRPRYNTSPEILIARFVNDDGNQIRDFRLARDHRG